MIALKDHNHVAVYPPSDGDDKLSVVIYSTDGRFSDLTMSRPMDEVSVGVLFVVVDVVVFIVVVELNPHFPCH